MTYPFLEISSPFRSLILIAVSLSPETSFSISHAISPFPRLLPLLNSIVDRFFPLLPLSNILHKRLHFNLSRYSRLTSFLLILSFIKFLSSLSLSLSLYSFHSFSMHIYTSFTCDDSTIFSLSLTRLTSCYFF